MLLKNETACYSPLTRGRGWPVAVEFQEFREVNAGDVFIARALEVPRSSWRWAGGQVKWWREKGGGEEDMRGQPIKKDSLPFFLFLRGKKRIGVKSGGGRGRGGKEEERGGGRTPIQGSTRPVGMECRYKSSPRLHPRLLASWPVPSFRPSLSSFFPSPSDTSSSSSTSLFGIHRRPRCCSPNHHRVLPLYRLHHLLLHCACLLDYYYAPLPLCSTTIITTTAFECCCCCCCCCSYYHDLVTICGRSLHSIIDSN